MLETPSTAQKFLDSMTEINKQRLLNALLGLDSTHALNCNTSFYSYRNLKKSLNQIKLNRCKHYTFPIPQTIN